MGILTILAIDPGTNHTGICVLDLHSDGLVHIKLSETIHSELHLAALKDITYIHGIRFTKIYIIAERIKDLLQIHKPQLVVSESPFWQPGRTQAYTALVELIATIRSTVFNYNQSIRFDTIDPSTIKNAANVKGTSGDKTLMRDGIDSLGLSYDQSIIFKDIDEHGIDAVAVGYCKCIDLIDT